MRGKDQVLLLGLTLWATLLAILTAWLWRFETPMPVYWADAQEFARVGRISGTFAPNFYSAVLGTGIVWFGKAGVFVVQGCFYILSVLTVYAIFRLLFLPPKTGALATALIALCPDLLTSISKIWDTEAVCCAVLGFASCLLLLLRAGPRKLVLVLAGIYLGFGIALRPNFPVMVLPLGLAIWFAVQNRDARIRRTFGFLLLAVTFAGATLYSADRYAHGSFYFPQNGPYNFFAGANKFTGSVLLLDENAEPSIPMALAESGVTRVSAAPRDTRLNKQYMELGERYIHNHPLQWSAAYSALKLFTLFRPDTKIHRLRSAIGVSRLLVSLGVPLWIAAFLWRMRLRDLDMQDWILLALGVVYVLPFMVTNSDPRLGFPLLLLFWVHAIALVLRDSPKRLEEGVSNGVRGRFRPRKMARASVPTEFASFRQ